MLAQATLAFCRNS